MTKLNDVKVLDMVDGEITKIQKGIHTYELEEELAARGSDIAMIRNGYGNRVKGEFFEIKKVSKHTNGINFLYIGESENRSQESFVIFRKTGVAVKEGDIVVITDNTNQSRNEVGDIGKVGKVHEYRESAQVHVPSRPLTYSSFGNYTKFDEMRMATPEEVLEYDNSSNPERKKFEDNGREYLQFRGGDIVEITEDSGEFLVSEVAIGGNLNSEDFMYIRLSQGKHQAIYPNTDVKVKIVCFAEDRQDRNYEEE